MSDWTERFITKQAASPTERDKIPRHILARRPRLPVRTADWINGFTYLCLALCGCNMAKYTNKQTNK